MEFIIKTAVSKDGTVIGYRQTGQGRGLIICHEDLNAIEGMKKSTA